MELFLLQKCSKFFKHFFIEMFFRNNAVSNESGEDDAKSN